MRQVVVELNCITRTHTPLQLGWSPASPCTPMNAERDETASDSDTGPQGDAMEGAASVSAGRQPQRRGRPRGLALPHSVTDALVMLRLERDQQFLDSADGRHRRPSSEIWDAIAAELNTRFAGVAGLPLTGRGAMKKWSYIEALAKVRFALPDALCLSCL